VQLRLQSKLTSEEYITREAWRDASLRTCPMHPRGGCGFRSCGSYLRKVPSGLRIARWYCPRAHCTFSLVPDFAATRIASTLVEIEDVVTRFDAERAAGQSVELAARSLRPDIEPQGSVRWVQRRRRWVSAAIAVLVGIAPELFAGCEPTVAAIRAALGCDCLLVRAREIVAAQLAHTPAPLGFAPLVKRRVRRKQACAHVVGPDPPSSDA
jgi:hypothetical protein